jgi:glycosyltransferase involved in cell wall biosynthesis
VLAVSWCLPPALFPRSIQVARLLKGLKAQDWRSTVVTPAARFVAKSDPRDPALEEAYRGQYELAHVDLTRADTDAIPWYSLSQRRARREALMPLDRLWAVRAAAVARAVIRQNDSRVLVTFAQPWRDHLVGLELAGRLPWVAHFSDPWVDNIYDAGQPEEIKAEERRREAQVVEKADIIVFTNRYVADLVMSKYPEARRSKVRIVPHATDEGLMPAVDRLFPPPPAAPRPMRLIHVGNLFAGRRTAAAVFDALAIMNQRRPLDGLLEFVVQGEGSGLYEARAKAFTLNLDAVVRFQPRVSYLESLATMRDSDVLLLIDAPAPVNVFFPSKLADYVMMRKPILALTPPVGPSADIMTELGYPSLEPGNVNAIVEALEGLLEQRRASALPPSPSAEACAAQYSLATTARAFAGILDAVARH